MATLLLTVLVLTVACIVLPLWLAARGKAYRLESVGAGLVFFAAIGLGFMLIEISQMERLMIFLGHPMYGLTVALFALLIFSSLGSLLTGRLWKDVRAPDCAPHRPADPAAGAGRIRLPHARAPTRRQGLAHAGPHRAGRWRRSRLWGW